MRVAQNIMHFTFKWESNIDKIGYITFIWLFPSVAPPVMWYWWEREATYL